MLHPCPGARSINLPLLRPAFRSVSVFAAGSRAGQRSKPRQRKKRRNEFRAQVNWKFTTRMARNRMARGCPEPDACQTSNKPSNHCDETLAPEIKEVFGWGGRIRTYGTRLQKPLPYHLATPQPHLAVLTI